jgi:hypothetical protein
MIAKLQTMKAIVREDLDDKSVDRGADRRERHARGRPPARAGGRLRTRSRSSATAVEQIAAKVSRSTEFVRKRLEALRAHPRAATTALLAEKILPGVAMLLARIPDVAAQKKALDKVLPEKREYYDARRRR